jgi:hypothetical protein
MFVYHPYDELSSIEGGQVFAGLQIFFFDFCWLSGDCCDCSVSPFSIVGTPLRRFEGCERNTAQKCHSIIPPVARPWLQPVGSFHTMSTQGASPKCERELPEPATRRLGLFRRRVSFHKLLVIFFDDRLLLGVWNWSLPDSFQESVMLRR